MEWPKPILALVVVLAALPGAGPAHACTICIDPPEKTVIDRVLVARDVVLAREDPERPFAFAPVTVLKGNAEGEPIPFLLDSTTRRGLAAAPRHGVFFAREGGPGGWDRLVVAGPALQAVVADVLARGDDWMRPSGAAERFETFAALHDHEDPVIRQIALAEFDRTPYRLLRTLSVRLPREEVRAALDRITEIPWAPVRIRLLGIGAGPVDAAFLRRRLERRARTGGTANLAPLATALIEVDGAAGIARLLALYGPGTDRTMDERQAVVTALALHGTDGDPALRRPVVDALEGILAADPALAPAVAVAFTTMGAWSRTAPFRSLLAREAFADPRDDFVVTSFVSIADRRSDPAAAAPPLRHPFAIRP